MRHPGSVESRSCDVRSVRAGLPHRSSRHHRKRDDRKWDDSKCHDRNRARRRAPAPWRARPSAGSVMTRRRRSGPVREERHPRRSRRLERVRLSDRSRRASRQCRANRQCRAGSLCRAGRLAREPRAEPVRRGTLRSRGFVSEARGMSSLVGSPVADPRNTACLRHSMSHARPAGRSPPGGAHQRSHGERFDPTRNPGNVLLTIL